MSVAECDICGRPVMLRGRVPHVEFLIAGRYARAGEEVAPAASQGLFPVGPDCAAQARRDGLLIEVVNLDD